MNKSLPWIFMAVAALSRWPGLFPPNFSAFYGLAFCAGVFFPARLKWWLPLGTLLVTDVALDLHYHSFSLTQLFNYVGYAGLIWFGGRFKPRWPLVRLLAGGLLGAIAFYLITNTAAWLFNPFHNPEYTRTLAGWITALTSGTHGYPTTIEFFRNTLTSGGLFTGLFAGAAKLTAAAESAKEKEPAAQEEEEPKDEPAPEPSDAG
ncbi:conserved membrane hypothetical protein [Verrucomicrobia bacterium]|nr:conserved membrane hypothetical protein [Verrucomicrobiota bacterium]